MKARLFKRVLHHLANPLACSETVYDPERKKVLLCVLTAGHEGTRHMAYSRSKVIVGDPDEDRPEEAPAAPVEQQDPHVLRLSMAMPLSLPVDWCRERGYRAIHSFGGIAFQRGDEPVVVASVGDTLRWDGEKIVVNEFE
jgi:hypothetical protein